MPIKNLFLPELYFLDLEDALPGGLLPKCINTITFNDEIITLLLPFYPDIFTYLNPADLIKNTIIEVIDQESINISLKYENQIYSQIYLLKENNAIKYMPVLTVYPNFQAKNWQEYYTFYYDSDYGEKTFSVKFKNCEETEKFRDYNGTGSYQINRLKNFPEYIICTNFTENIIGLIILPQPPEISLNYDWRVGIDFGEEFTYIYISTKNSGAYPFDINKNLQLNITESCIGSRLPALIESFIPDTFLPSDEPLPLCTVLTTRNGNSDQERAIFDGRIYIPDPAEFDPDKYWIKLKLTWKNNKDTRLFLKNLVFIININAASNGIKNIQYSLAYPNNFLAQEKDEILEEMWQKIFKQLELKTGIKQLFPKRNDQENYRSKNLALGYYWKYKEKGYLLRTTILNIDRYFTDICIWQRNEIIYQCSIPLGHHNIFSEILAMNPRYTEKLTKEFIGGNWGLTNEMSIMKKIDVCLRHKGEEWLKKKRVYKNNDPYFQNFITIVSLGITGLYYYLGLILKTLYQENKYHSNEITAVYIGGNHCNFLHWLSPTGIYDKNAEVGKLLSLILSKSSELKDSQEKTQLSTCPKHEIACGLVLGENNLIDNSKNIDKIPICGENYLLEYEDNRKIFRENKAWNSQLILDKNITKFDIPEITHLQNFLDEFHIGLNSLKIDSIQPLAESDYKLQKSIDRNSELWKEVRYHLENELLNIKGDAKTIQEKIPFIMGLKSLLHVLGRRWADSYKN
ncbi:MAG: hypothetical protein GW795_09835 [Cyanobacteria bacterium]|nr:hypothetical protein [Cyanobacteria bacterium CG_2015-16_32_12]NCO77781.1 hypothetical protein [Cyanobacteria bacterium CG_2015-22_32_23]NCQ04207.1 hypothetical protein [Cyanobacteria bacterium CG_2015-09_32_10]NCQ42170.1 hypothetical protein [Cyanobacteria bacterium CG_2015-04_32_10]NCS83404.1 hypothetical protein [Cyanobacteria bacterium CG_2015-02_32_10]